MKLDRSREHCMKQAEVGFRISRRHLNDADLSRFAECLSWIWLFRWAGMPL